VKQKHLKETIDLFNNNPIKPRSGGGAAVAGGSSGTVNLNFNPLINAINSLKGIIVTESSKIQSKTQEVSNAVKSTSSSNAVSVIKTEIFTSLFKSTKKLDLAAFIRPALTQFADSTAVSLGFELEFNEGATRISESLQKGFASGTSELRSILTEQITQSLGIPLKQQPQSSNKPRVGTTLNNVVTSDLRNSLISNEIINFKKESLEVQKKLDAASKSDKTQKVQKSIRDLTSKLDRYERLLKNQQALEPAARNIAKIDLLQKRITKLSGRISKESKRPEIKALDELQTEYSEINSQIKGLGEVLRLNQNNLQESLDNLAQVSTKQLESQLKGLNSTNQQLTAKLQDYQPIQAQINRFDKVIKTLEKKIASNTSVLKKAQFKKNTIAQKIADLNNVVVTSENRGQIEASLQALKAEQDKYSKFIENGKRSNALVNREIQKIENLKSAVIQESIASGLPQIDKSLNDSLRKTKAVKAELDKRYNKIPNLLKDVGAMLGLNLKDIDTLPDFKQFESDTMRGYYDGLTNTLGINSKYAEDLNKRASEVSSDLVATLAHELSHGMQSGFDAQNHQMIAKGIKKPKLINNLKKITKEESAYIGGRMGSFYDDRSSYVKLKEIDAYLTGLRVKKRTEAIKKVAGVDTTLAKEVESISSFRKVILQKAQEMISSGTLDRASGEQIIRALEQAKSKVLDLKEFSARSRVEGTLNPEEFTNEFESELEKIKAFKKAILEGVTNFDPNTGIQLPDENGKVKKQRKSKRENAIESVSTLSEAVSKLNNNSLKAVKSVNDLALKIQALETVAGNNNFDSSNDPWGDNFQQSTQAYQGEIEDRIPLYETSIVPSVSKFNQSLQIAQKVLNSVGNVTYSSTKALYGFAKGMENIALNAIPMGHQLKQVGQVALPIAGLGAASIAVPGLGTAIGAVSQASGGLLMPVFEAGGSMLASGISGAIAESVNLIGTSIGGAVAESVPLIGQSVGSSIIGALPEIGSTLGSAATSAIVGSSAALGEAAGLALPVVATGVMGRKALDAVGNSLTNQNSQKSLKAGEQTAKVLGMASKALADTVKKVELIKTEITPLKQLKGSSVGQQKYLGAKDVKLLSGSINVLNTALVAAESNPEIKSEIARQKASLTKMLKARLKLLKSVGVDIVVDTPSLQDTRARKAKKVEQVAEPLDLNQVFKQQRIEQDDLLDYELGDIKQVIDKIVINIGDREIVKSLRKALGLDSKVEETKKPQPTIEELDTRLNLESTDTSKLKVTEPITDKITNPLKSSFDFMKAQAKGLFDFIKVNVKARATENKFTGLQPNDITFRVNSSINNYQGALEAFESYEQETLNKTTDSIEKLQSARGKAINSQSVGSSLGSASREAYDVLSDSLVNLLNLNSPVIEMLEGFTSSFMNAGKGALSLKSKLLAVGTIFAIFALTEPIKELARFQLQLDTINKKLQAVNESPRTNVFDEFGEAANKANTRVMVFAEGYADMIASLKGKSPNARETIFSLGEGFAKRGVVGEGQERSMYALSQMASKGVVSMEELRQQLGDHLAGAFGIASRAMGLTEFQMISLVSSGQLLSSEFLPKFAEELNNTSQVSSTFTSELVKLQNTFEAIKFEAASVIPFKQVMQALNGVLSATDWIIKPLIKTLALLGGVALLNLISQLGVLTFKLKFVQTAFMATATLAKPVILIATALYTTFSAWDSVMVGSASSTKKLNKELQRLAREGIKEVKEGTTGYQSSNPFVNFLNNTRFEGLTEWGRIREESVNIDESNLALNPLADLHTQLKSVITNRNLEAFATSFAQSLTEDKDLGYKISKREAFGITQEEAVKLQESLDSKRKGREDSISKFFGKDKLALTLQKTQELRKNIDKEIEKGADPNKYVTILAELDITEASLLEFTRKINAITLLASPIFEVGIQNRALQSTLSTRVGQQTTQADTKLYNKLADENPNSRSAENQIRLLQISKFASERQLTLEANKLAESEVGLLMQSQKERLARLLGNEDLTNASFTQIAEAKERLAIENQGTPEDIDLSNALLSIEALATNTQKLNEIKQQEAQFSYETAKIVKELGYEFDSLKIESLQKALSVTEFNRDAKRQLSPNNDDSYQLGKEIKQQAFDLKRSLYDMNESFNSAIRGLEDFNFGLLTATRDLKIQITQAGRDLVTAAANSVTNYLSVAGLEDILGLNKFREIFNKGVSITQSDRRPQIQNEIDDKTRDYNRQTSEQERQQSRLNMDVDSAIFNLKAQIEDTSRTSEFTVEDKSLDFERLRVRYYELENETRTFARTIEGFNSTANDYGQDMQMPLPSNQLIPLSEFESTDTLVNYLESQYSELNKSRQDAIGKYEGLRNKGNTDYDKAQSDASDRFTAQLSSQKELLKMEGDRLSQANQLLVEEIGATVFSFNQNLAKQLQTFSSQAIEARKSVNEIFTGVNLPVSGNSMIEDIVSLKANEIDSKLLEFKQLQEKFAEYRKIENPQRLFELIGKDSDLNNLAPEVKNSLLRELGKATTSEDFEKAFSILDGLGVHYDNLTNALTENKGEILEAAKQKFLRESDRKIEDAELGITEEHIQGKLFQTDKQKANLQIDLDEQKAKLDLKKQVEDLTGTIPPEQLNNLATTLESLNNLKFDRLRREASDTYKVLNAMQQGLESSFANIFTGIGESLFKGADKEKQILEINADYGNQLKEVEDKFGDDSEQLAKAKDRLEVLNESKLDKVRNEFSLLGSVLGTVKNAFIDFAKMMLETVAKIAAQKLAMTIMTSIMGGGSSGAVGSGMAAIFGGAFALGGEIGEGRVLNPLSDTIRQSMTKEGSNATLIVASRGEHILSARKGDAQFYRALEKSGKWREMRSQGINNYSLGGAIGSTTTVPLPSGRAKGNSIRTTNVTNTYNLHVKDTNTMRRTQQQMMAEAELRAKRSSERNS
ncbi:MAG: tape measure protein, partial [Waterburya sp.]